jgi:hypothetical protein
MKIVISACYGGFGLSVEAEDLYAEKAGFDIFRYANHDYLKEDRIYSRDQEGKGFMSFTFKKDHGDKFSDWPHDESYWCSSDTPRDDKLLVEVVEELGEKANSDHANLQVIEIPDGIDWEIDEYDGYEHIAEKHQTWG